MSSRLASCGIRSDIIIPEAPRGADRSGGAISQVFIDADRDLVAAICLLTLFSFLHSGYQRLGIEQVKL